MNLSHPFHHSLMLRMDYASYASKVIVLISSTLLSLTQTQASSFFFVQKQASQVSRKAKDKLHENDELRILSQQLLLDLCSI